MGWMKDRNEDIAARAQAGESIEDIARVWDLSPTRVRTIVGEYTSPALIAEREAREAHKARKNAVRSTRWKAEAALRIALDAAPADRDAALDALLDDVIAAWDAADAVD